MQTFGNYQVVQELGRGAVGVVYEVQAPGSAQRLALKALPTPDAKSLERFRRECDILRFLGRHPNVISMWDAGEARGQPYIVMDLIEGGRTLQDLLYKEGAQKDQVLRHLVEVARAVHFAHEAGVVHRDLKPANVLVDGSGRVLLADFGIAKNLQAESMTKTGDLIGSPAYMSPEQVEGSKELTKLADVYSLGAMLYEVLAGQRPFEGDKVSVLKRILMDEPEAPHVHSGERRPALEAVAMKAISKEPADRHPTAEAFAQALEEALAGAVTPAAASRSRVGGVPLAAVGLAVGALLGGGLALAAGGTSQPPAQPDVASFGLDEVPDEPEEAKARFEEAFARLEAWEVGRRDAEGLETQWEHLADLAGGRGELRARALVGAALSQFRAGRSRAAFRSVHRAIDVDVEAVVEREQELFSLLSQRALALLETVDAGDPTHAPRVDDAREALFAARLLRPQGSLTQATARLRILGRAPSEQVRWAAQPWTRIWRSSRQTEIEAEQVEEALDATYSAEVIERIQPLDDQTFPRPWAGINWEMRIHTGDSWRMYMPLGLRHDVLVGWLIERPELTFLWHWVASTAMAVGRPQVCAWSMRQGLDERTHDGNIHQSQILWDAGVDDFALELYLRRLESLRADGGAVPASIGIRTGLLLLAAGRAEEARDLLEEAGGSGWLYLDARARVAEALGLPEAGALADRAKEMRLEARASSDIGRKM